MRVKRNRTTGVTRLKAGLIAWLCLLGACASKPPAGPSKAVPAPPPLTAPYAAQARAGKSVYRLDSAKSSVWILVDKSGPLASFGHRHVIKVGRLQGFASVAPGAATHADVRFPVASLEVDAPGDLKHFGVDDSPSKADIKGTRNHMLGESVLDANRYPWVNLQISIARTRTGSEPIKAIIQLHGQQKTLDLSTTLAHPARAWKVTGGFSIKQTEFGITPYSVMLGALRVKDKIDIRYDLVFVSWKP